MSRAYAKSLCFSLLCVGALGAVGCGPPRVPPATVEDLMQDRVTLDGIVMKCNSSPHLARTDPDCDNARIAIERIATRNEVADDAKRQEEFEHKREELRLAQEREHTAKVPAKVDAYHLPLVNVEASAAPAPAPAPAPAAAPAPAEHSAPIVGQTNQ
jgi:hypothetical protein